MARDLFVNGECMVSVRGNISTISTVTQLGLAQDPIEITVNHQHMDVGVDAWGGRRIPPEIQYFLSDAVIRMNLVHIDRDRLDDCLRLSMGGVATVGLVPRTGTRMMNNGVLYGSANSLIELRLSSPVGLKRWRFPAAYLTGPPVEFPLGTERSIIRLTWRAVPHPETTALDPWGGGTGSSNAILWSHPSSDTGL